MVGRKSPELARQASQTSSPRLDKEYSRAFENLVNDDEDVVGLLAYALFKQAVREDVARGAETVGNSRNPSPTVITAYRQAAERRLEELISANIENATPEIQQSATLAAISTLEANLKGHVTSKTGFVHAIFSNVVAWIITLAATVLILSVAGRPDAEETLADTARSLGGSGPVEQPIQPATVSTPTEIPKQGGAK